MAMAVKRCLHFGSHTESENEKENSSLKHYISCADIAQLSYLWEETSCVSVSLFGITKLPWKTYPLVETAYELKCLSNHTGTEIANINTHNTARYTTSHHIQVLLTMFYFLLLLLIKISIKYVVASPHAHLFPLVITVGDMFPPLITVGSMFLLAATVGTRYRYFQLSRTSSC